MPTKENVVAHKIHAEELMKFIFYNHGQNLWNNIKKSSKIWQDEETLFIFA